MTAITRRLRPTRQGPHGSADIAEPDLRPPKPPNTDAPLPDKTNPSVGRSTRLGRKMEKPANVQPSGPSGQKGGTQHQKKHANR